MKPRAQKKREPAPVEVYDRFECVCGWSGDDTKANHGFYGPICPDCGRMLDA